MVTTRTMFCSDIFINDFIHTIVLAYYSLPYILHVQNSFIGMINNTINSTIILCI